MQASTLLVQLCDCLAAQSASDVRDGELLRRFAGARDAAAFAALVHRHAGMVLNACRRLLGDSHDAEDACQATFLLLVEKAPQIRKPDAVASWLHGTARRVCSDLRDRRARRAAVPLPVEVPAQTKDVARAAALRELGTALDEELE